MKIFLPRVRHTDTKKSLKRGTDAGFSLLEILVVLAIMGLMLSLVSVRMVNSIEGARFSRLSDGAVADIRVLRAQALIDQKPILVVTQDTQLSLWPDIQPDRIRRLNTPETWTVSGSAIKISRSGVCLGGDITVKDDTTAREATYTLTPPQCKVQRAETAVSDKAL